MIWIGLIAFGIFGLCTVGGSAGWFLIAIGAAGLLWKGRRVKANTNEETKKEETVQITKNIYGAIETFAMLGHSWKRRTGWKYDTCDFANVNVQASSCGATLKMQFRGDCLAVVMDHIYPEIRADSDNIVCYESSEVHSFDADNLNALWEAFSRGCPNAVLDRITQDSTGIWLFIKFSE